MEECRPDWDPNFCTWLLECIQLSLDSAVGKFENNWYRGEIGIPTGGTLCVHLADMTVYKIFRVFFFIFLSNTFPEKEH